MSRCGHKRYIDLYGVFDNERSVGSSVSLL